MSRDGSFSLPSGQGALAADETLRRWLHPHSTSSGLLALSLLNCTLLKRSLSLEAEKTITLDRDAPLIETAKADADRMYTKKRGYLATIATIAEYDYLLHERLCRGNASPGSHPAEFLDACLASLPSLMRIGLLRADSASYRHTVLNGCEAQKVRFLVCGRLDAAVREAADSLPSTSWQWREEQNGDYFWIAEKTHILNKGLAPFRLILIRRPLKRGQYQQGALFSGCELVAA